MRSVPAIFTLVIIIYSCSGPGNKNMKSYQDEIEQWRAARVERLRSPGGWLNLAGLFWLEEGENTIGSDSGNTIVFPGRAPLTIGKYTLAGDSIVFTSNPGEEVRSGEALVSEIEINTDRSDSVTILETGSYSWFVIERNGRFGIRLRDFEHPALATFHGIDYYPVDREWVINAEFVEFEEPREIEIPTVLGYTQKSISEGLLRFSINGQEQELYPSSAGKGLFIVFADETSGLETYGGGRFMYTEGPDDNGLVELDFNRAYNPPCAFTPFATCPLPPGENILSVAIEAGEKFAGH